LCSLWNNLGRNTTRR